MIRVNDELFMDLVSLPTASPLYLLVSAMNLMRVLFRRRSAFRMCSVERCVSAWPWIRFARAYRHSFVRSSDVPPKDTRLRPFFPNPQACHPRFVFLLLLLFVKEPAFVCEGTCFR